MDGITLIVIAACIECGEVTQVDTPVSGICADCGGDFGNEVR